MARVMQQLRGNENGQKRGIQLASSVEWATPALLHCEKMESFMMVHGNVFVTLGDDEALSEVEQLMSSHDTIWVRAILGAGRDMTPRKVRILNRFVRWNSDGERS